MAGSVAASTARSYDRVFKTWISFAETHHLPIFPVNPIALGNCLSEIADSSGSFATISTLVAAIARYHWDRFTPSPTENFSFRRLLQGFRRRLSKPPKPKDPLTPEILASAIHLVRSNGRLQEWRTVARMCFAFYAGCRWSDTVALRISHLQFDSDGLSITIPKSKTDQLGRGETVYIQFAMHPACPVSLIQDYIERLLYEAHQDGYLQPRISSVNGVQRGLWNTTVSYSTALNDLKLMLTSLGYDASRYGEHSGRRGGATAASDAGVDWTDLMSHGRWKSVSTPLGYLANSRRRQKRVAQALAYTSSSSDEPSSSLHSQAGSASSRSVHVPRSVPAASPAVSAPITAVNALPPAVPTTLASAATSASSRFNFRPLQTLAGYRAAAESASNIPISHPEYLPAPVQAPSAASNDSFVLSPSTLDALFQEDASFEVVVYDP